MASFLSHEREQEVSKKTNKIRKFNILLSIKIPKNP